MNYEICLAKSLTIENTIKLIANKINCPDDDDLSIILDNLYLIMSKPQHNTLYWICTKEDLILLKLGIFLRNRIIRQQRTKNGLVPMSLELEAALEVLINDTNFDPIKAKDLARKKSDNSKMSFVSFEEWSNELTFINVSVWLDLILTILDKWNWYEVCLSLLPLKNVPD